MPADRVWTPAEMELLSPDERARLVVDNSVSSLDGLDAGFRDRVDAQSRRIAEERGLLDTERS